MIERKSILGLSVVYWFTIGLWLAFFVVIKYLFIKLSSRYAVEIEWKQFWSKMLIIINQICQSLLILNILLFQSDIVHQSVYELVHSEDREELQRQILWNSFLPPEVNNLTLQDVLRSDRAHLLERSFTVRFRCLLDNTSGFLVSLSLVITLKNNLFDIPLFLNRWEV